MDELTDGQNGQRYRLPGSWQIDRHKSSQTEIQKLTNYDIHKFAYVL